MSKYKGIDKETILKIKEVRFPFASGCIDLDIKSVLDSADEINKALENHRNKLMNDTEMRIICEMAMKYLEELAAKEECKEEAYNKGLEDGRNEVWELANKIFDMDYHTTDEVFGCDTCEVMKMTPQEALAKLEAYEKEQNKIKAGYVYEIMGKFCAVVQVDEFNNEYHIIWCDGGTDRIPFETPIGFKKTGKHIDIQSILQQIGGTDD